MKIFNQVREFFWPLLEKEEIKPRSRLEKNDINVDNRHLEETLKYAIENYKSEEERRKNIESKSSLFISIISVVTAIILGVTTVLIKVNDFNFILLILIFILFLLSVYMSRTIWFALKTLERKAYFSISINDFLISEKEDDYFKRLIVEISNKINQNSIVINEKVDNMTMAQEYFKRAIIVVSIYSLIILIYFASKTRLSYALHIENILKLFNAVSLSSWNIFLMYLFIMISLILSIRALRKK
ncbi:MULTISPECIES: hypothetical protein [Mesonia]|uniref:Uncharacterized protein n=1 Tax=Mesonia oceanica TaxID=2687242 RepID=A0AC61Y8W2_9FLAO|nr:MULTISPECIES: hypothetical protein [Mesonia]MAN28213.1 hypothetical protein [Mesonia sp.]MAQ41530.1 hypothetical protein [Mesonia sp.]MBJ96814.1 hypothetical protein [Flavobacteriaceae bacterium]VVV00944.1 hypothetical protein FVB9532_02220 [Mesonia oceanica]|tara:strand:- start:3805 stop:4533 length:729 start_codon:yes stop_codon:yes gene_type:complete